MYLRFPWKAKDCVVLAVSPLKYPRGSCCHCFILDLARVCFTWCITWCITLDFTRMCCSGMIPWSFSEFVASNSSSWSFLGCVAPGETLEFPWAFWPFYITLEFPGLCCPWCTTLEFPGVWCSWCQTFRVSQQMLLSPFRLGAHFPVLQCRVPQRHVIHCSVSSLVFPTAFHCKFLLVNHLCTFHGKSILLFGFPYPKTPLHPHAEFIRDGIHSGLDGYIQWSHRCT